MELLVKLTLSDELFDLLDRKLPDIGHYVGLGLQREAKRRARNSMSVSVEMLDQDGKPVKEVPTVPEPVQENTPIAMPVEPVVVTAEVARAALNETRRRLLGDDLESKKQTPEYKSITSVVKQLIMSISGGSAKTIPAMTDDQRATLVAELEALALDDNGMAVSPKAPY